MYGTIMRAKLTAGQQDAFRRFAQELGSPAEASGVDLERVRGRGQGSQPDRRDHPVQGQGQLRQEREHSPNQRQLRPDDEVPGGSPEWIDVHYVAFQGETRKEYIMTGSMPGA